MDLITRVLLAATKRLPIPGKLKWKIGLRDEIAWWDGFMAENYIPAPKNPNGLSEEAIFRLDETAPLQDQFVQLLKDTNTERIRILDVGCGPFSLIGKVLPRKELDITAVDPLAEEYIKLQSKHGIVPPVTPQRCDAEELDHMFEPDSFDLVHANNCLDHSYDPVEAIRQMFNLTKPGGYVYLRHEMNVAEISDYVGLHQWNFRPDGDEFWISNKNRSVNVCMDHLFEGRADLQLSQEGGWMVNIIHKH